MLSVTNDKPWSHCHHSDEEKTLNKNQESNFSCPTTALHATELFQLMWGGSGIAGTYLP
jgi:hypothetical protein